MILNLNNSIEGKVTAEVTSLLDASTKLRHYIEVDTMWELGASGMRKGFGDVTANGKYIGTVSYNGRIWIDRECTKPWYPESLETRVLEVK